MPRYQVPTRVVLDFSASNQKIQFFRAIRSGVCAACDAEYQPGDLVTDDEGDIVGKHCCYSTPTPVPRDKVCSVCHLELPKSGVCGVC